MLGKSLDKFMGMDNLVKSFFKEAPEISSILLLNSQGTVLFPYNYKGNIPSFVKQKQKYKEKNKNMLIIKNGMYHLLFTIKDPITMKRGLLDIKFSKKVVYDKVDKLIKSIYIKLILFLLVITIMIFLTLNIFIVRPLKKRTKYNSSIYELNTGDVDNVSGEILDIEFNIYNCIADMEKAKHVLARELYKLNNTIESYKNKVIISTMIMLLNKIYYENNKLK